MNVYVCSGLVKVNGCLTTIISYLHFHWILALLSISTHIHTSWFWDERFLELLSKNVPFCYSVLRLQLLSSAKVLIFLIGLSCSFPYSCSTQCYTLSFFVIHSIYFSGFSKRVRWNRSIIWPSITLSRNTFFPVADFILTLRYT